MSLIQKAILEANELKRLAIEQAKENLQEAITPRISSMLNNALNEEADENFEEAVNESETEELDEDFDVSGFVSEEKDEDSPEATDEPATDDAPAETPASDAPATDSDAVTADTSDEPTISDETAISDLTVGELKGLLMQIISGGDDDLDIAAFDDEAADAELDSVDAADSFQAPVGEPTSDDDDEDLNLESILAEVESRLNGEAQPSQLAEKVTELESQLTEVRAKLKESNTALKTITKQLVETNLLNAQYLYMNKLYKGFNLTDSQKAKVVENISKAKTTKEAKMIYETLDTTLRDKSKKPNINENLGFASKSAGVAPATKGKTATTIFNDDDLIRIQKLAGIRPS